LLCAECFEEKPATEFPGPRAKSDGTLRCKRCHKNWRLRESTKRKYGSTRHYHLRQRYGVGAKEVDAMIEAQGGLCALCQERPAEQVDHDHKTGKVRAILCLLCNAGIGAFKDDPEIIRNAIKYLERNDGFAPMP
jgi:hypothetical protein